MMRKVGPFLPEHRVGRDNLRAAFPQKSAAEIEQILAGVWDNLGRVASEFAHLDEFCMKDFGPQTPDAITFTPEVRKRTEFLDQSDMATLFFSSHLAIWELPAIIGKLLGLNLAVLYRRPNIGAVNDLIIKLRTPLMGELIPTGLADRGNWRSERSPASI